MLTYNDLQLCTTEEERIQFIGDAINEHELSDMFKVGKTAGEFYRNIDVELERQKNYIFDSDGNAIEDTVSPNHKLTANFFYLFTTQLVAYLLGNGVSFDNPEIKDKLGGSSFDYAVQQILAYAACDGEGYGYFDGTEIKPLCFACKLNGNEPYLIPLKDEDDGEIKAAIRYWRLTPESPLRATLFELDGYTEYKERVEINGNTRTLTDVLEPMKEKAKYKPNTTANDLQGVYSEGGENYSAFPIVPMGFICGQSSIVGNIGLLHAYNVILSDMANGVDKNVTYWKVKNADGMDRRDDSNLLADIYKTHVLHLPEGVEADRDEVSMQTEHFQSVLDRIEAVLYDKFQAVRTSNISAGSKTTVEIKAAYENLNLRCDEVEKYVAAFIRGCLAVIGEDVNEPFHFKRPNNINQSEFVQLILAALPVIGDDVALKQILESLGMIDEYETIKKEREAAEMQNFTGGDDSERQQFITDIAVAVIQMMIQQGIINAESVQNNSQSGSATE